MPIKILQSDITLTGGGARYNGDADIIGLGNGKFLVIYSRGTGTSADAMGQIFSANGVAIGAAFKIDRIPQQGATQTVGAQLSNGNVVVCWVSTDSGDGAAGCLRGQILGADGSFKGASFIVNSQAPLTPSMPRIDALGSNGFAVSWNRGSTPFLRQFDNTGHATAVERSLKSSSSGTLKPDLAGDGDGGAWVALRSPDTGANVYFTHTADPGSYFSVGSSIGNGGNYEYPSYFGDAPRIAALRSGGGAVVHIGKLPSDSMRFGVYVNLIDGVNMSVGKTVLLGKMAIADKPGLAIAGLDSGQIVVAWTSQGVDDQTFTAFSQLNLQIVNENGSLAGAVIKVATGSVNALSEPELAALDGGRFALSWTDGSASEATVHAALYNAAVFTGTSGGDTLRGSDVGDYMEGAAGNDVISGRGGGDTLLGGSGNDRLSGGVGRDFINGGDGSDTAIFGEGVSKIALDGAFAASGAAAGDRLVSIENLTGSDAGADFLRGNAGANLLSGLGGNDTLRGAAGNDTLAGGKGADRLDGGNGLDTASYQSGGAVHVSLDGSVVATGNAAGDIFSGIENIIGSNSASGDVVAGNTLSNVLSGMAGPDLIFGRAGNDDLNGGKGNDTLVGGNGRDLLNGGSGRDLADYSSSAHGIVAALDNSVEGTSEARGDRFDSIEMLVGSATGGDTLYGDDHANWLFGEGGNDLLRGNGGDDVLYGGAGADVLDGGTGVDTADYSEEGALILSLEHSFANGGSARSDTLRSIEDVRASNFDDRVEGSSADNYLYGAAGNDVLTGLAGDDVLTGGTGIDSLHGGSGKDVFAFFNPAEGHDVIFDFSKGDTIYIDLPEMNFGYGFTLEDDGLPVKPNHITPASFGSAYFSYDTSTHSLWVDTNGSDAGGQFELARFANKYILSGAEVFVI